MRAYALRLRSATEHFAKTLSDIAVIQCVSAMSVDDRYGGDGHIFADFAEAGFLKRAVRNDIGRVSHLVKFAEEHRCCGGVALSHVAPYIIQRRDRRRRTYAPGHMHPDTC